MEECLKKPDISSCRLYDYQNPNRILSNIQLLNVLLSYLDIYDDFPNFSNHSDFGKFEIISNEYITDPLKTDTFIKNYCFFSSCNLSPICTFLGGIAAQEVTKIFGLYTPIHQWFLYDINEAIPPLSIPRLITNTRQEDQIVMFGNDLIECLSNLKYIFPK